MTLLETQTYRRIDRRAKLRRNPGLYWIREDPGGFAAALTAQKTLGRLPRALRKTSVQFEEDETRTYGGLPGGKLAELAGRVVLTALDEGRCLYVLRGIAEALLAPLKMYMRVKLVLQRLDETITQSRHSGQEEHKPQDPESDDRLSMNARSSGSPALLPSNVSESGMTEMESPSICHPGLDPGPREIVTDSAFPLGVPDKSRAAPETFRDDGLQRSQPAFRWRESPASIYKFKEQTAALGYDPRGTSVYWIERRAAQLRAQWKRHHRPPSTRPPIAKIPKTCTADDRPMRLKDFKPADADYGSIWPPIELPAPPQARPGACEVPFSEVSAGGKAMGFTVRAVAATEKPTAQPANAELIMPEPPKRPHGNRKARRRAAKRAKQESAAKRAMRSKAWLLKNGRAPP